MKTILLIGHVAPGGGGVAAVNRTILNSDLWSKYEFITLDTTRGKHGAGRASTLHWINVYYFLRQLLVLIRILVTQRPDLVHLPITSYWSFWKGAVFILLIRLFGAKVLAHVHGGAFDKFYTNNRRIYRYLIRRILGYSSDLIVLSTYWERFFVSKLGIESNRIHVLNNPYSYEFEELLTESANKATSERPIKLRQYFLFMGSIAESKGVFTILEALCQAIPRIPDVEVVFAGTQQHAEEMGEAIRLTSKLGLEEKASFVGYVSGTKKIKYFKHAIGLLLPSYVENFPIVLLEGLRAGLPIITSPVGGIPEIVEDGRNGFLIEPGDSKTLAEKMIELWTNRDLAEAIGIRNRKKALEHFSPDIYIERLAGIYDTTR